MIAVYYNLYIPEADEIFQYENGGTNDIFVDRLLNQAYTQTENYDDTITIENNTIPVQSRYYPGGKIRVYDTRVDNFIGMEGVRVQARRWFIWFNGRPDFNGNYSMPHRFSRPCNYSIWFETNKLDVRHNTYNTTFWINGPKKSGDWNYDLNNQYQRFAGHVFRGAYRYNHKDIGGLKASNNTGISRYKYIAVDAAKTWSGITRTPGVFQPISRVARYHPNKGREYYSDEVFSTTCHETAHTMHATAMSAIWQFWQVDETIQESWAVGIEWFITHMEYADRGIKNYGDETSYYPNNPPDFPNTYGFQYFVRGPNIGDPKAYSSLFIDIVDNYNQQGVLFSFVGFGLTVDNVSGYTLPQIEKDMLKHIYSLTSLADQLKANKPANVTDAQIDELLGYFW